MIAGRARLLVLVSTAAGCFAPDAREGLACSEAGDCPPGQSCQAGTCSGGSPVDAAVADGPEPDAGPPELPLSFGASELVVLTCPGPAVCADVRDPFLDQQRTTILFTYLIDAVNGNYDIYFSTRAMPEGAFPVAGSVGPINSTLNEHTAFMSDDGTSLWFARQDVSSGTPVRPYDEILLSKRVSGPFEVAAPVEGGVNTLLGDERSPQVLAGGQTMLFTRAPEIAQEDHDVYLARYESGQWNTIELVRELSAAGGNDRSLALVEAQRAIFFIRDDQIHEAIWTGEDPTAIAIEVVHDELDAVPLDSKIGLWASPDGAEIWFDSNRSGVQQIYRAVRAAPTGRPSIGSSGGRIRRRPIR